MMVAVMAQMVTMFRRRPGTATGAADAVLMFRLFLCRHRRPEAEQRSQRTMMASVDRGVGAHAGLQLLHIPVVAVEIDSDRHALHHLDEIARGILRRQDRELRAGARAQRADSALEGVIRKSIDIDRDRLPD